MLSLWLAVGCAVRNNFDQTIFRTLAASKLAYEQSIRAFAEADHQGKVNNEDMRKFLSLANQWQKRHNEAVQLAKIYKQTQTVVTRDRLLNALAQADELYSLILEFIHQLKEKRIESRDHVLGP